MRTPLFLFIAILSVVSLNSQQPTQPPAQQPAPQPVFRTTTRLIQVNVVALDKKGKPVTDLKKEDFTLFDKGKQQTISLFAMENKSERRPLPKLGPGMFSNYTGGTTSPNLTVILIDSLNTQWGDQSVARLKIIKFLEQIKPEDRVSLMVLGRQLKVLHSFTDDRQSLLNSLKKWGGRQEVGGVESPESSEMDDIFGGESGAGLMAADFKQSRRIIDSLASMEAVGNYLAGSPGRKNLIWVSGGFPLQVGFPQIRSAPVMTSASSRGVPSLGPSVPRMGPGPPRDQRTFTDEVDKAMKVLNNANVAVYPVDARGLTIDTNAHEEIGTMQEFASRTGGKAFFNRNDLDTAIRQVMEETEVTYTLAFYPTGDKADGQLHDLKVKVSRPGVSIRSRKGYVASRPEDNEKSREQQLTYAVHSPIEATGIVIIARVVMKEGKVQMLLIVDPNGVNMEQEKDKDGKDRWKGRVDILIMQRDKAGNDLGATKDTLDMYLLKETYGKIMSGGLRYTKEIVPAPGAEFLRIIVRDATSTLAGSVTAKW